MGASNFELVFISSTWDCTTFHNFLPMFKKKIQKLAGLWLAGEVVNHVGIYGSKAAEGLSAFQRRSCLCEGRQLFQWIGYDYRAYVDYMDHNVCCSRKAVKLNHSFTHSPKTSGNTMGCIELCKKYLFAVFVIFFMIFFLRNALFIIFVVLHIFDITNRGHDQWIAKGTISSWRKWRHVTNMTQSMHGPKWVPSWHTHAMIRCMHNSDVLIGSQ